MQERKKNNKKSKLLISACLFGENCRYDGLNSSLDKQKLSYLKKRYQLFPFCPEVQGGLPIPRDPNEIISESKQLKIQTKEGVDNTIYFVNGARKCLDLVKKHDIKIALLKSKSPSCGIKKIYDGSFSKKLINKMGVTAQLLKQNDIKLFDENEFDILCMR